jgi:hypothetical protein
MHGLRYVARRSAATDVVATTLDVRTHPSGGNVRLHITNTIRRGRVGGKSPSPIVFDLSGTPFRLLRASFRADSGREEIVVGMPTKRRLLVFQAPSQWQQAKGEFDLEWSADQRPFALLPDGLPLILSARTLPDGEGRPQPRIEITPEALSPRLHISGIPAALHDDKGPSRQRALVQAALVFDEKVGYRSESVVLTEQFCSAIRSADRDRITQLVAAILHFVSGRLNSPIPAQVVLAAEMETSGLHWLPSGVVIAAPATLFGVDRTGETPNDVVVARRIASLWWGGVCRLSGGTARELEFAIAAALGLQWTAHMGEGTQLNAAIASYERIARQSFVADLWWSARDYLRPRVAARLALAVYRTLSANPATLLALGALLRRQWGCFIPSREVTDTLGLGPGVGMP